MAAMLAAIRQRCLRGGSAAGKARLRPLAPARQRDRRAEARRRRNRGADPRDPVVERQLAADQAVERVGHRRLDLGAFERMGEQRHEVERLDGLPDAGGDLRGRDPGGEQLARLAVAALRRQRGPDEVAGAGEPDHRLGARALLLGVAPDLEEDVPGGGAGGVEALGLRRARGQRGGVLGRARELDADRVARALADDAGAGEDVGDRPGEPLVGGRGDERGALGDHLTRVRGPADARDARGAEARGQQHRRGDPVRRHEALGERDHRRAAVEPALGEVGDDLAEPARGDAEEDEVGAAEPGARRLDAQLARQRRRRAGSRGSRGRPRAARTARACASGAWCGSRRARAAPRPPCRTTRRPRRRRAASRARAARGAGEAASVRYLLARCGLRAGPRPLDRRAQRLGRDAERLQRPCRDPGALRQHEQRLAVVVRVGRGRRGAQLDHGRAQQVGRAGERREDARRAAVALDQQREQDVLGVDDGVLEAHRLAQRGLERALGPRAERDLLVRRRRLARPHQGHDRVAGRVQGHAELGERAPGRARLLGDQPEQQVLGADLAVPHPARLVLGERDDLAGLGAEALEHLRLARSRAAGRGPRRPPRSPRASWPP